MHKRSCHVCAWTTTGTAAGDYELAIVQRVARLGRPVRAKSPSSGVGAAPSTRCPPLISTDLGVQHVVNDYKD